MGSPAFWLMYLQKAHPLTIPVGGAPSSGSFHGDAHDGYSGGTSLGGPDVVLVPEAEVGGLNPTPLEQTVTHHGGFGIPW